ncbi:MAG TPA: hypothetical protein VD736_01680 [Nitrososphaera sp.]|nr:hypothetical protein [Nitrososphaera sp.]
MAVAVAAAVVDPAIPMQGNGKPNVKFTEFTPDRIDIRVGEATKVIFNVQNLESRAITDARVVTVIEPSGYQPYLSIDRPTIELSNLQSRDARTGQTQITITAASSPAREAVYTVKGVLYAEGEQTDIKEFELRIRE